MSLPPPKNFAQALFNQDKILEYSTRYFKRVHKGFGQVQDTLKSYFE